MIEQKPGQKFSCTNMDITNMEISQWAKRILEKPDVVLWGVAHFETIYNNNDKTGMIIPNHSSSAKYKKTNSLNWKKKVWFHYYFNQNQCKRKHRL